MWPLPISPSRFSERHLAVVEDDGTSRRPANAQLVFFAPDGEAGKSLFHQECRKFFAVDLGKNGEQVREAGIGDPHLFAVKDVVVAVGGKLSAGAAVQGIGAGRRFRQGVCANNFAGGQARQIFLFLLLGAEINQRQQADAGVRAPGRGKSRILRNMVGDDSGRHLIHFEAAVSFRDLDAGKAQVSRLLQQIAGNGEVLVLHFLHVGQDFVDREFFRGLPDQLLLLSKVFGCKDFVRAAGLK